VRKVVFMPIALAHLEWWIKEHPKTIAKIIGLANNAAKSPFSGLGKPEPLKANFKGYWSRRITHEHRMVYKVLEEEIIIMSVKGHY